MGPRSRAPPPAPLALPEFESTLPALPLSPASIDSQTTPSSSTSSVHIPSTQRPIRPTSISYDSYTSQEDEVTPWGSSSSSSASSPLRGSLATRLASVLGRAQPAQPTTGVDGFQSNLSSEEIRRQAMEERDRSRREAEMVLAREEEEEGRRGAAGGEEGGGTIKASRGSKLELIFCGCSSSRDQKERGPFFDATNSPSPRPSTKTSINHADHQTPTRSKPTSSHIASDSLKSSPYLVPRRPESPTLDLEASLTLLANRFTKLEAWTVAHVRSLEEKVDKMETRVQAVEARDEEVGNLRRDLNGLRGAMREGFKAMEALVPKPVPAPPAAPKPAVSLERVKEEPSSRAPPAAVAVASTPPLVIKRSPAAAPPLASTPPESAAASPSTTPKPRTFAPVVATAPLRTSHRSTVSISSIPHPVSTQSFSTIPQTSTPSLGTPTLALPRSSSPNLIATSTSAPTSPSIIAPPRKRYTTALGERGPSPSPLLDTTTSNHQTPSPRSTPLPSSPFAKPATPIRSSRTLGGLDRQASGRRRSRSVGGGLGTEREVLKASNLKRAEVGSLVAFWDKS